MQVRKISFIDTINLQIQLIFNIYYCNYSVQIDFDRILNEDRA